MIDKRVSETQKLRYQSSFIVSSIKLEYEAIKNFKEDTMDKKNPATQKPQSNPKQQQPAQKPGNSSTQKPAHKKEQF